MTKKPGLDPIKDIHRHPNSKYRKSYDIYSLSVLMIEGNIDFGYNQRSPSLNQLITNSATSIPRIQLRVVLSVTSGLTVRIGLLLLSRVIRERGDEV
jgi:hypothetical protein